MIQIAMPFLATPPRTQRDRWSRARAIAQRYGIAAAIFGISTGLRAALHASLGDAGFVVPLVATLLVAWLCGLGPCVLMQTAILLVEGYWFPRAPVAGASSRSYAGPVAYYAIGILMAVVSDFARAARRRELQRQDEVLAQREQLRATLLCMADGVIVTDEVGRISLMNPQAESLTGWKIADALGRPAVEVFPLRDDTGKDRLPDPVHSLLASGATLHDVRSTLVMKHRGELPTVYSATPLLNPEGGSVGVVVIFRDDSERRHRERMLYEADRRKDEFLATLAHELRNPLAPIRTGLELIKMSVHDTQAVLEVRSMMDRQAQHMSRLIDDLLDVSRITRGKLQLKKGLVDIREVVASAIEATKPQVEKAGHQLQLQSPAQRVLLHADAHRLTQVFSNLIDNAAKYTPPGGRIRIEIQREEDTALVCVEDNGIGIPSDMQERVFELFTQVDRSMESAHSGLGIGLTLVKRLVELHHGRVHVESLSTQQGIRFVVELPVLHAAPQPDLPTNATTDSAEAVARRRVLVVDDNRDARETLSMMVRLLGHEVAIAHDGLEAVAQAETFLPEVVLLDIGMPRLNGYEAAKRIREVMAGHNVLLVATTGWGQEEDRVRTHEAGFDHHWVKPIDPTALRKLLAEHVPLPKTTAAPLATATTN